MYVHMCVCAYSYVYVYIHVCMYVFVRGSIYVCMCIHIYTHMIYNYLHVNSCISYTFISENA